MRPRAAAALAQIKTASMSDATTLSRPRCSSCLCLLWLGGITLRVTILAVPPVIPLIHDDLHLSETQVGLLMGLPLAMFAIAAVPGSLLVARFGALRTLMIGMVITALAGCGPRRRVRCLDALCRDAGDGLRHRDHAAGAADAGARMGAAAHGARQRHGLATACWSARRWRRSSPFRSCCRWSAAAGGSISSCGRRRCC